MSALRFLFMTLLLAVDFAVSAEERRITAEAGQDVTLPCGDGKETPIRAMMWIRPDLDPDGVLFYRDGRCESDGQHPSFRNRVDLQDRRMKDGDASLILKNVTIKDTGTYQCRVYLGGGNRKRAAKEIISSIHLEVSSPPGAQEGGDKEGGGKEGGGYVGLFVGPTVVSLLCVLAVGVAALICYRKPACLQSKSKHLPVKQTESV